MRRKTGSSSYAVYKYNFCSGNPVW
uniref:Uncharacterized protein n=1 Tax=Arundo donax TaxID=35708 RepID=A0A0A9EL85_ARUDO